MKASVLGCLKGLEATPAPFDEPTSKGMRHPRSFIALRVLHPPDKIAENVPSVPGFPVSKYYEIAGMDRK